MLPDHYEYYYTQKDVFGDELDNIHAFVMKNYRIGMHVQEFLEINVIIKGSGNHYIEENCIEVGVGDIFIIPPNVRHGYLGNGDFDVFHILVHSRFLDKHSADFHTLESYFDLFRAEPIMRTKSKETLHLHLSDERFARIRSILSQMEEYPDTSLASDCLARSGLAMVLIPMLCKEYSESKRCMGNENRHADNRLMQAISKIHESYNERLTVDQLAKIANLSRSAFVKRFTDLCKIPPSEYIANRRIEAAEYMLKNTALSITDIAFESGFYDASHLNKLFIAKNGISPNAFRKLYSSESKNKL